MLSWDLSSEPFRRWSELRVVLIVVKAVIEGLHQEILDFEHYASVCSKTGQGRLSESGHQRRGVHGRLKVMLSSVSFHPVMFLVRPAVCLNC